MRVISCILLPRTRRSFERHTHDSYEFHYVIAGRGSFEVRGRELSVRPGDFFYTRPRTMHRTIVPKGQYLLQYVVFLELHADYDAKTADDLEALLGEGRIRRLGDRYHALFAKMSRQCLENDPRQHRAAAVKLAGVLYDLMLDPSTANESHPAIERALEFIRSHVAESYRLDDLVAGLGLDKSYFIRLFKKSVGVSPMKYALNLKMSAAADLLRTTDEPLAAVGARGLRRRVSLRKAFQAVERNPAGRASTAELTTTSQQRTNEGKSAGFSGANVSLSGRHSVGVDFRFGVQRRPRLAAIRAQEGSP